MKILFCNFECYIYIIKVFHKTREKLNFFFDNGCNFRIEDELLTKAQKKCAKVDQKVKNHLNLSNIGGNIF